MAKHGPRLHLKRIAAPKIYPIERKHAKWTVKPASGKTSKEETVPLLVIVRDVLKLASTAKEAKFLINNGDILVDGKPEKDYKYPVSLFDIIEVPKIEKTYRVLFGKNYKLKLVEIPEEEKYLKPLTLINKTFVKKGKLQLNLYSGRNVLVEPEEKYVKLRTKSTIVLNVHPKQEIKEIIPMEEGAYVYIRWGRLVGTVGRLKGIERLSVFSRPIGIVEDLNGVERRTIVDYIVPLGKEEPIINIPREIYE